MNAQMKRIYYRLCEITEGCREDMHEPDEQGLTAIVEGTIFDNAGTPNEIAVYLCRDGKKHEAFKLADLIALARRELYPDPPRAIR